MSELLTLLARAGGGGSGGGGGAAGIIALPIVIIGMIVAWWRRRKQIAKAKKELAIAKTKDSTWDKAIERASEVFYQFEADWSNFHVANMKEYLTPRYFEHISLMLEALQQMKRRNRMSNVRLTSAIIFSVSDSTNDTQDNFDIEIRAAAHDELIDLTENQVLFVDDSPFTEIWNFDRQGNRWLLDKIGQIDTETVIEKGYVSQADAQAKHAQAEQMKQFAEQNNGFLFDRSFDNPLPESQAVHMQRFAKQNQFFYNADFGWLLLPTRGELFTLASFGRSDINYHVIGKYRDVLVQFYQYIPVVPAKRQMKDYLKAWYKPAYRYDAYIVAQAVLPKTYGNIIVKRKGSWGLSYRPAGMTQIHLEGVDFNKYFAVYATDIEKATSLELLNPAYMEKLLAVPFTVNIEIVDNVVYLYSADSRADFNTMLTLLQDAFEEMKL